MNRFELNAPTGPVELVVGPRLRPLGGLQVNRVWPTARRRLVGPFVFFDHMIRARLAPGIGLDVPPHPHIGIATVTYLFEGELMHADSLGCRQRIRPGEINWMSAGRGITHAERSTDEARGAASVIHGIQSWVALPLEQEVGEPAFVHYGADGLPRVALPGIELRVLAGRAFGATSAVQPGFDLFYVELAGRAQSSFTLDAGLGQRAVYILKGALEIANGRFESGRVLILQDEVDVEVLFGRDSRLMLFGGQPLAGERFIDWNFVASDKAMLDRARTDWIERRFPPVPGDDDYMPYPGT